MERRLRQVEKDLAGLKATASPEPSQLWYRQMVGSFAGDPLSREIVRLGRLAGRGKLKS